MVPVWYHCHVPSTYAEGLAPLSIGSNCHGSSVTVTELIALSRVTEGLTTCLLFVTEVLE